MQETKVRDSSMDVFRIMCCLGVLVYHVMDDVLWCGKCAKIIYFGASFCVPGFFFLSGYLIGTKNDLNIEYIEKKIFGIIAKLFGWVIFWNVIHYIRTNETFDAVDHFVLGLTGNGGVLAVSWFLFTYSVLLIVVAYPLWYIEKHKNGGGVLAIAWMIALSWGVGKSIMLSRAQPLWLYLYAGYFSLGLTCVKLRKVISKNISRYRQIGIALLINACSMFAYTYEVTYRQQEQLPSFYYGQWFYTLWLVSLFWLVTMLEIKRNNVRKFVKKLSENTFVVYLGHLPMLLYITELHPIQNVRTAILLIVLLFFVCELMAEIFRKLPILRKLV